MQYLLSVRDGFTHKALLTRPEMVIGRDPQCDLRIDLPDISRRHARLTLTATGVEVADLASINGLLVGGELVSRATIQLGGSFSIGGIEFSLCDGEEGEFTAAGGGEPRTRALSPKPGSVAEMRDTRPKGDMHSVFFQDLLAVGLRSVGFDLFLNALAVRLDVVPEAGHLALVELAGAGPRVVLVKPLPGGDPALFDPVLEGLGGGFSGGRSFSGPGGEPLECYSVPLVLGGRAAYLLAIAGDPAKPPLPRTVRFLVALARQIELIHQVVDSRGKSKTVPPPPVDEGEGEIVTVAPAVRTLVKQLKRIAASDIFVLVHGESGTGKELMARLVHQHSRRKKGALVALNCAAIPENLLEAELFGYEKGAFTGAITSRQGKLELASGGTLVLDEIGDMPLAVQVKLLRVLEEHEFYRLGGLAPIRVDLRIVALTNRPLREMIVNGAFREDLYYRLAHHVVTVPPLRDRREDVAPLLVHFCNAYCEKQGKRLPGFSVKAFEALKGYHWPGNVRQLRNEVHRLVSLTDENELISYDLLTPEIQARSTGGLVEKQGQSAARDDRDRILMLLEKNRWNKSQTARDLGMTFPGLFKKLKRLGIETPARKG